MQLRRIAAKASVLDGEKVTTDIGATFAQGSEANICGTDEVEAWASREKSKKAREAVSLG
jgi:hypothetical protein